MQRRRQLRAGALRRVAPLGHLRHRGKAGREPRFAVKRARAGKEPVQHINGYARQQRTQRRALIGVGDEEAPAALFGEPPRHRRHAEPIGVRLDDRPRFRARRRRAHPAPVRRHRAEIDGQHAARRGNLGAAARIGGMNVIGGGHEGGA